MDAEDEAEVTEPRADYTIDELRSADHAMLAEYAFALQNALKIALDDFAANVI